MSEEDHILVLSCGDTSGEVPILRDATSGEVRSWWIMCVGLQAGRSVELYYEWGGS